VLGQKPDPGNTCTGYTVGLSGNRVTAIFAGLMEPNLDSPSNVLVTLRAAIEFNAPDDEPVDVFLAVICAHDEQEGFLPGSCLRHRATLLLPRECASSRSGQQRLWLRARCPDHVAGSDRTLLAAFLLDPTGP